MTAGSAYDDAYDPPAPVVPISISAPGDDRVVLTPMLVDTGADCTLVPERLASSLRLPRVGQIVVRGVTGEPSTRACYAAVVRVGRWRRTVRVIALDEEAILGRDVLASFVTRLDGPSETLRLTPTRSRRV